MDILQIKTEIEAIITELQVNIIKQQSEIRLLHEEKKDCAKKNILELADALDSIHKLLSRIKGLKESGKIDDLSFRFFNSFMIVEKQLNKLYHNLGGVKLGEEELQNVKVDPAVCEIVDTFPTDNKEEDGIISSVIKEGHKLRDGSVLRFAKVIIFKYVN